MYVNVQTKFRVFVCEKLAFLMLINILFLKILFKIVQTGKFESTPVAIIL